jgi:transposase-like protein
LRWPEGITCPRCKHQGHSWLENYDRYECNACQYQFTVISGTVFQDTHLELTKWFVATYLLCESRKGMSANQIKRIIGGSYKTAWYLCHRIRAAMAQIDQPMLSGVVKSGTLAKYIKENISADVEVVVTDELTGYPAAMIKAGIHGKKHKTVNHKAKEYVRGDVYTNTVESAFSLLKRGIVGTWHKISAKHLQAYLNEMTFRFDRRKNSDLFIDTLRHMITAPVLGFEKLTA